MSAFSVKSIDFAIWDIDSEYLAGEFWENCLNSLCVSFLINYSLGI